jgi:hypothetical protein
MIGKIVRSVCVRSSLSEEPINLGYLLIVWRERENNYAGLCAFRTRLIAASI